MEEETINKICWMMLYNCIDFEHRMYEEMMSDEKNEEELQFACGRFHANAEIIECLSMKGEEPIERAKKYVSENDVSLYPVWIDDNEWNPDPRFKGELPTLCTLSQELNEEYESS